MAAGAEKMPAQPQALSFSVAGWGAESVPRKKPGLARGRGVPQGQAVALALGHRQAVHVGADAAGEHGVAVDHQVVDGDGAGDRAGALTHEIDAFLGG